LRPSKNDNIWKANKGSNTVLLRSKSNEDKDVSNDNENLIHQSNNQYQFDHVFGQKTDNANVYHHGVSDTIKKFVAKGINASVIAYGQPRSGKTYTMYGNAYSGESQYQPGVIHMIANDLFSFIENIKHQYHVIVRVSFIEVYKEELRDLLGQDQLIGGSTSDDEKYPSKMIMIRDDPRKGIFLSSSDIIVRSRSTLYELIEEGYGNTLVSTLKDDNGEEHTCSKSHTVFRITIERREKKSQANGYFSADTDQSSESNNSRFNRRKRLMNSKSSFHKGTKGEGVMYATLNIVDVASANERNLFLPTEEDTEMRETVHIDQSFLTLSRALIDFRKHKQNKSLSLRDSKLTRILQSSLTGNSTTALICCMATDEQNLVKSKATLELASRIKTFRQSTFSHLTPDPNNEDKSFGVDEKPNETIESNLNEKNLVAIPEKLRLKTLQRQLELKKKKEDELVKKNEIAEDKAKDALEECKKMKTTLDTLYGDTDDEKDGKIKKFKWKSLRRAKQIEDLKEQSKIELKKIHDLESEKNNLLRQINTDGTRIKELASSLSKSEKLISKKNDQIKKLKENKTGPAKLEDLEGLETLRSENVALEQKVLLLSKESSTLASQIEFLTGTRPKTISEYGGKGARRNSWLSEPCSDIFLEENQDFIGEISSIINTNKNMASKKIKKLLEDVKITEQISQSCDSACVEMQSFGDPFCNEFTYTASNDGALDDGSTMSENTFLEDEENIALKRNAEVAQVLSVDANDFSMNEDTNPEAQRPLDEKTKRLMAVIGKQLTELTELKKGKLEMQEQMNGLESKMVEEVKCKNDTISELDRLREEFHSYKLGEKEKGQIQIRQKDEDKQTEGAEKENALAPEDCGNIESNRTNFVHSEVVKKNSSLNVYAAGDDIKEYSSIVQQIKEKSLDKSEKSNQSSYEDKIEAFKTLRNCIETFNIEKERSNTVLEIGMFEEKRKSIVKEMGIFNDEIRTFVLSIESESTSKNKVHHLLQDVLILLQKNRGNKPSEKEDNSDIMNEVIAERDTYLFQRNALVEEISLLVKEKDKQISKNVELEEKINEFKVRFVKDGDYASIQVVKDQLQEDTHTEKIDLPDKDSVEYKPVSNDVDVVDEPSELTNETAGDDLQYLFTQMKDLVFERDSYEDKINELKKERDALRKNLSRLSVQSRKVVSDVQKYEESDINSRQALQEEKEFTDLVSSMHGVLEEVDKEMIDDNDQLIKSQAQSAHENQELRRQVSDFNKSFKNKLKQAMPRVKKMSSELASNKNRETEKISDNSDYGGNQNWMCDSFCQG